MIHSLLDMDWSGIAKTYRSGQWLVVECATAPDARFGVVFREALAQVGEPALVGVALDLSSCSTLESGARTLLLNFHKSLIGRSRQLALVIRQTALRESFVGERGIFLLPELSDLKRGIHEMSPARERQLIAVSQRMANLQTLMFRCPVCQKHGIRGYYPDPALHRREWHDNEITLQWVYDRGDAEALDIDCYRVAVCVNCLFAASRPDWFTPYGPSVPLGDVLSSTLPLGAPERLVKSTPRRRQVVMEAIDEAQVADFFGMPRERRAAALAWRLAEETLRAVARDREGMDAFGVAMCQLMQARFSPPDADLTHYFSGAYVWLRQVVENPQNYAEDRLAEAYVYLLSVNLALGRGQEAHADFEKMNARWNGQRDLAIWLERATDLLSDAVAI